jgi:quercetin dioxygenase-like cupin family protein
VRTTLPTSSLGVALLVALAFAATSALAQEAPLRLSPAEIAAMTPGGAGPGTSGVVGIRTTILSGDPTKPGPYTIEIRVPAHTRIAAHTHRDDRSGVVISGAWLFGYGAKADEALTKRLPPGGFYTEPAGEPHFAMTGDEAAVVYITGFGPTDTRYVDSASQQRP